MRILPTGLCAIFCFLIAGALTREAHATLIVNASVGGAATGLNYANFDNLPLGSTGGTSGGLSVAFTSGDASAVQGSASGLYAAPYLSGSNGALFGDPTSGPDATTYLSTGIGTITLYLPGSSSYLGLLWGSVDTYNSIELFNGTTLVGTVTGTDVTANANGNQGVNGTFYVNINSSLAFNTVELISTQYAFEFDDVAYDGNARPRPQLDPVPEPGSLALLAAGLASVLMLGWRRRAVGPLASLQTSPE